MRVISEHTDEIDGHLIAWRSAPAATAEPVLWVHGVPESSAMWLPFLERVGGIAVDLPGFGRSGKRTDLPYTLEYFAGFLGRFLDHVGVERVRLCCHDWGGVGLAWAAREPQRVERVAAVSVVPLGVAGFRWHWVANLWRRRVVGEVVMGSTSPLTLRVVARRPKTWAREVHGQLDQGTQRAILRLYRDADPERLAQVDLSPLRTIPSLVVWGERDPFLPVRHAAEMAAVLEATTEIVSGAGHWPWHDDEATIGRLSAFLGG